jgi:hypothetical protein
MAMFCYLEGENSYNIQPAVGLMQFLVWKQWSDFPR